MKWRKYGAIPSPYDIRDYKLATSKKNIEQLPQKFRLPLLPIKNQGTKPTCVAHALAEIIEYHNYVQSKNFQSFSTEFIYGCREKKDYLGEGMMLRQALKNVQKYGDVLEKQLPGNHDTKIAIKNVVSNFKKLQNLAYENRISTYYKINTPDDLKLTLYKYGPAIAGIKIYNNYTLSKNNIYQYNTKEAISGHAVVIIGWTKKYWIIQNSWGKRWGDKGKFYIPIDKSFKEIFFQVYGITDDIYAIKTPHPFIKKYNKPINKILNIFRTKNI